MVEQVTGSKWIQTEFTFNINGSIESFIVQKEIFFCAPSCNYDREGMLTLYLGYFDTFFNDGIKIMPIELMLEWFKDQDSGILMYKDDLKSAELMMRYLTEVRITSILLNKDKELPETEPEREPRILPEPEILAQNLER